MTALATIHVGKKQLGLDEDTYRLMLVRVTGKDSLRQMSEGEHQAIIAEMRLKGFEPSSRPTRSGRPQLTGRYAKKAQALWLSLWNLGAVRNRDDRALIEFARRQTGIDHLSWVLDAADGRAVIEALKAMCAREGVDYGPAAGDRARDGYRVAVAQWRKLTGQGSGASFWAVVSTILKRSVLVTKPDDREWVAVISELGKRIRAGQDAGPKAAP